MCLWDYDVIMVGKCFNRPMLIVLQELSGVAAAAGLPGADSWTQQGSSTWPQVWAAITKVSLTHMLTPSHPHTHSLFQALWEEHPT